MAFEDLFADPYAAIGFGLLTSRDNPMGAAAQMLQQGSEGKRNRERQEKQDRLAEMEMAQRAQSFSSGRDLPAAIQIANEYQKARQAGDTQRMNDIAMAAKSWDKGLVVDSTGQFGQAAGYAPALAGQKSTIAEETAVGSALGAKRGETMTELGDLESKMPQLQETVLKLSDLGKKATYTTAGRAYDLASKELGAEPRDAAIARAEYIAVVDNQVLPLLRQTFGAAFTVKEGETLRATLGDPNATPEEKDARLRAFIEQKMSDIGAKRRELGIPAAPQAQQPQVTQPQAAQQPQYNRSEVEAELRRRGLLK